MSEFVVWVDDWQMQCCGQPFGPGSHVTWTVALPPDSSEYLSELFGRPVHVDGFEDSHDLSESTTAVSGLVRKVRAVGATYTLEGKMLVPVPGSAEVIPVLRADGWEPETETRKFVGYLVSLDTSPAATGVQPTGDHASALFERIAADADRLALDVPGNPDELVRNGTDLLVAGFDTPEVIELAALSPGGRWVETVPVARAAYESIGLPVPPRDDAGWDLALFWAERLVDPSYPRPEAAAHHLWGLWWQLGSPAEVGALVPAVEDAAVAPSHQREAAKAKLRQLGAAVADRARSEVARGTA